MSEDKIRKKEKGHLKNRGFPCRNRIGVKILIETKAAGIPTCEIKIGKDKTSRWKSPLLVKKLINWIINKVPSLFCKISPEGVYIDS